jgi:hypothetical protein
VSYSKSICLLIVPPARKLHNWRAKYGSRFSQEEHSKKKTFLLFAPIICVNESFPDYILCLSTYVYFKLTGVCVIMVYLLSITLLGGILALLGRREEKLARSSAEQSNKKNTEGLFI